MSRPIDRIDTLRDRIKKSTEISDSDRAVLLEFSDEIQLRDTEYSDHRHEKLLRHCTILAENVGGLNQALDDRDAAKDLVRYINRNYDNEETNADYRTAIRVFGRRLIEADPDRRAQIETTEKDYPVSLAWIPTGTSSTYDPSPNPSEMLRWQDDVVPMLEAALNRRDRAMIAFQFDAGLRGGEFYDITIGALTDGQHGLQVTVQGKQGQRTVALVPSVTYLTKWIAEDHPAPENPDAPLWSKLNEPSGLSKNTILHAFRAAADRAGVTKPVTPTNFRKSSAAHLASKGMNQAHLEDHHGWVRGSKTASRYVSIFAEDAELETQRAWGVEVPEREDETLAPVECPRCGEDTPQEKALCVWCGQALEPDAARQADKVDEALVEAIANAQGEEAERLLETRRETRNDPELLADLVNEIEPLLDG